MNRGRIVASIAATRPFFYNPCMKYIADLHIHSHYSRSTSKDMNIVALTKWSQLKGTQVIGTGDFTHPKWFSELREQLEPAEPGLYRLKPKFEKEIQYEVPESCRNNMRFLLSVEISTIYKKNDRVRKVHSLVNAPSLEAAAKINARLGKIGNIKSDGRPILGLDTKELLKIVLDASEDCMLIPAHAWTPHFAVYGSHSGFDSLEECFEELTPYIVAIESGLSSDPAMNWRIEELKNRTIISNSDAHSAKKLGREANVFNTELSYFALMNALKPGGKGFESTIEFYPEEGKYHLDGHIGHARMTPEETIKNDFECPVCGKKVTVGVMHRVDKLANHPEGYKPRGARPFKSIVPLPEILSETEGTGPQSKKVETVYFQMLNKLGSEFTILLDTPIPEIEKHFGEKIAEAIDRVREGKLFINPGYDGEYGTVKIFDEKERKDVVHSKAQKSLFGQ